jgi:hypothetical protein
MNKPKDRDQRSHYHPARSHSENFRGVQNRQRFGRQKPVSSLSGTNVQGRDKYPPNSNFRGNQPQNFQSQRHVVKTRIMGALRIGHRLCVIRVVVRGISRMNVLKV